MLILGLLVVALGLLIFGLVQASAPLLIASLVLSLITGVVLLRLLPGRPTGPPDTGDAAPARTPAVAAGTEDPTVWVIDGRPRYHREGCEILDPDGETLPRSQAVEDGFIACSLCQPDLDRVE